MIAWVVTIIPLVMRHKLHDQDDLSNAMAFKQ